MQVQTSAKKALKVAELCARGLGRAGAGKEAGRPAPKKAEGLETARRAAEAWRGKP